MQSILRGFLAGTVATLPMSMVILAGRRAGLLYVPPPAQITANVEERAGVHDELPRESFGARWLASHFGYGGVLGVLYALSAPRLPRSVAVGGTLFGAVIWGLNYLGAMPALGLYPWPKDDRTSRSLVMVAAHLVFGPATSGVERLLQRR